MSAVITSSPVSEITRLHGEIVTAARTSLDAAIRIGELLTAEKAKLAHGQWLPWLKANVPFAEKSAQNYMRVYGQRDRIKSASVADLSYAYRLLSPSPARGSLLSDEEQELLGDCESRIDRGLQRIRKLAPPHEMLDESLDRLHASFRLLRKSKRSEFIRFLQEIHDAEGGP